MPLSERRRVALAVGGFVGVVFGITVYATTKPVTRYNSPLAMYAPARAVAASPALRSGLTLAEVEKQAQTSGYAGFDFFPQDNASVQAKPQPGTRGSAAFYVSVDDIFGNLPAWGRGQSAADQQQQPCYSTVWYGPILHMWFPFVVGVVCFFALCVGWDSMWDAHFSAQ